MSGPLPPREADATACRTARPSAAAAPAPPRRCRPPGRASCRHRTSRQDTTSFNGPVRGRPWKADGVPDRATGPDAVRYTSVHTATHQPTVTRHETQRDKKQNGPAGAFPQPGGRFRRWWQVLGSNQRRLSRRFYSPSLQAESNGADQRKQGPRQCEIPVPSAICPWAPGPDAADLTDGHGRRRSERYRRLAHAFNPLTCDFRTRPRHPISVSRPRRSRRDPALHAGCVNVG